jgi:hypothetical protein
MLALHLIMQGIPLGPAQTGTISGVLRTPDGSPAVGVRVSAMARPDSREDAATGSELVSFASTDAAGRYTLESIPPGLYYVTAGRVDFPIYFPGTQDMTRATVIPITPAASVTGINFVMDDTSVRLPLVSGPGWTIPFRVQMAAGKQPVSSPNGFAELKLTRRADGLEVTRLLNSGAIAVQPLSLKAPTEYIATVENLPDGYAVQSMTFGSDELSHGLLRVDPNNFQSPLVVTLRSVRVSTSAGVRVSGRAGTSTVKSMYLSGMPGVLYTDGTFEFTGVAPGVYVLTTPDNREHPRGGLIVVGARDLEGVALEDASMLPSDMAPPEQLRATPEAREPGRIPLPTLHGRVVELATKQPIPEGLVILKGASRAEFPLTDGRFEIPRLVPGAYLIEIQVFGHANVRQDVVIGDTDLSLNLTAERLY